MDMTKRGFLAGAFSFAASQIVPQAADAAAFRIPRSEVRFYNRHTDETINLDLSNPERQRRALNHFMRDFRTGEIKDIDGRLFQKWAKIVGVLKSDGVSVRQIDLISGYRSPLTNATLRADGGGQASNSQHTHGRASDIAINGVRMPVLQKAALAVARQDGYGGVGLYDDFVHVDTARLRMW